MVDNETSGNTQKIIKIVKALYDVVVEEATYK